MFQILMIKNRISSETKKKKITTELKYLKGKMSMWCLIGDALTEVWLNFAPFISPHYLIVISSFLVSNSWWTQELFFCDNKKSLYVGSGCGVRFAVGSNFLSFILSVLFVSFLWRIREDSQKTTWQPLHLKSWYLPHLWIWVMAASWTTTQKTQEETSFICQYVYRMGIKKLTYLIYCVQLSCQLLTSSKAFIKNIYLNLQNWKIVLILM